MVVTLTPVNPVSLTLTTDQVRSVLAQANAVTVTREMTLGQIVAIMNAAQAGTVDKPPCNGCDAPDVRQRLDQQEKALNLLLKAVLPKEPPAEAVPPPTVRPVAPMKEMKP